METGTKQIKEQAERKPIDAYARNKILSGSLAQDATVLAIMILQSKFSANQE